MGYGFFKIKFWNASCITQIQNRALQAEVECFNDF